uniref:Uncharacterized protein n=2 Tax=Latimeria chalumnae TaxID=7897 RepID=H2ZV36_LATCH
TTIGHVIHNLIIKQCLVAFFFLQVYQTDVTEMEILVNKDLRELRHLTFTVPLKETMLYTIPRDNDILFTLPNFSGKVDAQGPVQTTSHYPIRQVETTVDEESGPVKLPETPLRAEPPSSYKSSLSSIGSSPYPT